MRKLRYFGTLILTLLCVQLAVDAPAMSRVHAVSENDLIEIGTTDGETEDVSSSDIEEIQEYGEEAVFGLYDANGSEVALLSNWNAVVEKINERNDKTVIYAVSFPANCELEGNLKLPNKAKYAGLSLATSVTIKGNISLPGDLILQDGVTLDAKAVTANNVTLSDGSTLQATGKVTVKNNLIAGENAVLVLTDKKGTAIKNTILMGQSPIGVQYLNAQGNAMTPLQGQVVLNVSGDSYAPQYRLYDAQWELIPMYRKGNTIRVQGMVETPYLLFDTSEDGQDLGAYASLADIKTEIGRRKRGSAVYRVIITEEQWIRSAIPMPAKNTYKQLVMDGAAIHATGAMALTGAVRLENAGLYVKSVSGGTGSVLEIIDAGTVESTGTFKVDQLILEGQLSVYGAVTINSIVAKEGNLLAYDLSKNVTIKGSIDASAGKLNLMPRKGGNIVTAFPAGIKVISNMPLANVDSLVLYQEPVRVFYRDGKIIKIGDPVIAIFDGRSDYESCQKEDQDARFVTINDLIAFVNASKESQFVACLKQDVVSVGAMTPLAAGKHLILCSEGDEQVVLHFTGGITLDGSSLEIRNVLLDNKTTVGPAVILKNRASLVLENSRVNTISAMDGCTLTCAGEVSINGAVSGSANCVVKSDAVIREKGNLTAQTLTLEGNAPAQLRLLSGKKLLIAEAIRTSDKQYFMLNMVDKKDVTANMSKGTVLVTCPACDSEQFRTENLMPGTFLQWSLMKKGNNIQTTEASAGDGEWSGDYL